MPVCSALRTFKYIFVFIVLGGTAFNDAQQQGSDGCLDQRCGGMKVSYPFKLTNASACPSFSSSFHLICDPNTGHLLFNKAIVNDTQGTSLRVLALTSDTIALDVTSTKVAMKLTSNKTCGGDILFLTLPSSPSPYVFSDDNKLGSFGCAYSIIITANPAANISNSSPNDTSSIRDMFVGGCDVLCPLGDNNPQCGHNKCCVYHWPSGFFPRWTLLTAQASYISATKYDTETCSSNYGTLFHPDYSDFRNQSYGVKLKWALPSNLTTQLGIIQSPEYACSNSSDFSIVQEVPGYLCHCLPGYTGDGYAQGLGCSDIDECEDLTQNDCIRGQSTCYNTIGNYECHCKSRFHVGDGRGSGSGCGFSPTIRNAIIISISILGLVMVIACFTFLQIFLRKRLRRKYFKQNGGNQLQSLLLLEGRGKESKKLFKARELQAATNNYSNDMKLGVGGFGTVFKGVLEDGRVVAVKKANKVGDPTQFLNELDIMMQINHRNIVKFLGCCLETVEPLLVYEYVSNGNVMENLSQRNENAMDWEQRLNVARQTAEALAYLHGAAFPPILHRDVKSSNVLLDDNFDAKVADFGISRLVPEGASHISTAVQGTIGYLDPEYFQALQLTDKSDVYSLGVMLVELVTGLKPVDNHDRDQRFANLALLFIHHMQQGKIEDLIDPRLQVSLIHVRSSILDMAALALRCLSLDGSQRPSMSNVAEQLQLITHNYLYPDRPKLEQHQSSPSTFGAIVDFSVQTCYDSKSIPTYHSELVECTIPR